MKWIIYFLFTVHLFGSNEALREVQKSGVTIVDDNKTIVIHRQISKKCDSVQIKPKSLFGGDFADEEIPKECKKTFVTIAGVLQPMQLYKDIKTVGELEVLTHIKKAQENPKKFVLIDARIRHWYKQMTIPMAVNLPFNEIHAIEEDDMDEHEVEAENKLDEFENMIDILGIIQRKSYLDFSRAKTAIIFCNGSWCSQSPKMILRLINLGYPRKKLLWYRGGMQDWVVNGFTVFKGND